MRMSAKRRRAARFDRAFALWYRRRDRRSLEGLARAVRLLDAAVWSPGRFPDFLAYLMAMDHAEDVLRRGGARVEP